MSPEIPSRLTSATQFSTLCRELPLIVPPQAADNLSVHTILTILLHMCNEKVVEFFLSFFLAKWIKIVCFLESCSRK